MSVETQDGEDPIAGGEKEEEAVPEEEPEEDEKAAKKAKKQKHSPIAVGEKAAVVSTKPSVVRDVPQSVKTEGVIKTPAAKPLLTERDGKYYFLGTELPEAYRSISIYGEPSATKTQAVAYIKQANPEVKLACTVEELVDLYWQEAEREQVRPDLALAQSLVETGAYKYGGPRSMRILCATS